MPLSRNNEDFAKLFFGENGHPENMGLISSEIKKFSSEVFAHIPISPYFCSEKKRNNP